MADPTFPGEGGANPQGEGANVLLGPKIPGNCMKMKEFRPRGGEGASPVPPRSTNEYEFSDHLKIARIFKTLHRVKQFSSILWSC